MSARRPLVQNFVQIRPLGLLGKWVKYNENFSSVYITFFVDRPTGQTARWIFTCDGSDNVASRKGQTFSGTKI